jgi:hypothetical protein
MSKKLFHGSCHCARIKYDLYLDVNHHTNKCNCTFCQKNSFWSAKVPISDFVLHKNQETKKVYTNGIEYGYFVFCDHCGCMLFGYSPKSDWGEECYSIRIHTIDDISIEEMNTMPIKYYDGKSDTWAEITDLEIIKTL